MLMHNQIEDCPIDSWRVEAASDIHQCSLLISIFHVGAVEKRLLKPIAISAPPLLKLTFAKHGPVASLYDRTLGSTKWEVIRVTSTILLAPLARRKRRIGHKP